MKHFRIATLVLVSVAAAAMTSALFAQDIEPRVAPANNDFANRTVVSARGMMNGTFTITTAQDATFQAGEPDPSCTSGTTISDTVWYEFTAPHDIYLVIDTAGSSLNSGSSSNTAIAVYSSSSGSPTLATLSEEYCSTGGTGAGWATWFPLDAGKYFVQVGSEVTLSTASTYVVEFGSRYQLITNTDFGTGVAVTAPWVVTGTGTTGDKVVCDAPVPRVIDACSFRFKTSATESSVLKYTFSNASALPHDVSPSIRYSEFVLDVDYFTERSLTNAKAIIQVKFQDGTVDKGIGTLGFAGAIYVDPDTGATPVKAIVKIKHTGKTGKPLYITEVRLFYAPGATGRDMVDAVLPLPAAAR